MLATLTDFLKDRKQRFVLNLKNSIREIAEAAIPQAAILGLLLFLIHIFMTFQKIHQEMQICFWTIPFLQFKIALFFLLLE